jgi:hypothetical protein
VVVWQNGCVDTSECFIVHLTDISDQSFKQNITIYPNPNDGSFYIDLGKIYPQAEIAITELDGRIIQIDKVFNSQVIDMQIAAFPGMYLVNIVSGNERAVFKILKE